MLLRSAPLARHHFCGGSGCGESRIVGQFCYSGKNRDLDHGIDLHCRRYRCQSGGRNLYHGLWIDGGYVEPFSTSALVTGKIYAADYTVPTPTTMTTAISDMETAYTDAAGRTNPTATELGAGNIGGMTLAPGLYKWSTNVTIPTDVTLSGGPNDVWIFQVAGNLIMSSATHIILSGGAQAGNVFWVVAGQTTIGTTTAFNGNILDQTTIVLNTGATLTGRALAQAAVTLDSNEVYLPSAVARHRSFFPLPLRRRLSSQH